MLEGQDVTGSEPPGGVPSDQVLCVVGDFAWDVLVKTDVELQRGGDTFGDVRLTPGGSAANAAVWARRCGKSVHFVGKIGTDRLGDMAREDLEDEDVASTLALSNSRRTGSVAVLLDHTGERSMISGFGADFYLEPDELPTTVLESAQHLHLTAWSLFNDPPRTAALRAAEIASARGATISLDPASFQMLDDFGPAAFVEMTAPVGVDVLLPNFEEGQVLTGETDPHRIAQQLAVLYPGALIVLKLDAAGALVLDDGRAAQIPATPGELIDATGAGDAFAGAFLARWLGGDQPADSARFATRVAAWVIGQRGARPKCPPELVT